jgi:hypothetical protein
MNPKKCFYPQCNGTRIKQSDGVERCDICKRSLFDVINSNGEKKIINGIKTFIIKEKKHQCITGNSGKCIECGE